jgi:hypothetical protein
VALGASSRLIAPRDHDHCALIYAMQVKLLVDPKVGSALRAALDRAGSFGSDEGTWAATALERVFVRAGERVEKVLPDWRDYQARVSSNPIARQLPTPPEIIAATAAGAAAVAVAGSRLSQKERDLLTHGWNKGYGTTKVPPVPEPGRGLLARLGFGR